MTQHDTSLEEVLLEALRNRHGLDDAAMRLLRGVLEGKRGARLASSLDLSFEQLMEREVAFRRAAGMSCYAAANELLLETLRDSRPPPGGVEWTDEDRAYGTKRGQLYHRKRAKLLEYRAEGHMDRGMSARIIELSEQAAEREDGLQSFQDWSELASYDVDARLELTAWLARRRARFAAVHVLSRSRLVTAGVALAKAALQAQLFAYTDRESFEVARMRAWALRERAPRRKASVAMRDKPTLDIRADTLVDSRYRLRRQLGQGATGSVFLAHDERLDRLTALKFIHPSEQAENTVTREARALASLRHENVAAIYNAGSHGDREFVAMEYIEGTSFADVLVAHARRGVQLPLTSSLHMLAQVARGLCAVHSAGLIHRDVKPGNIVIEAISGRAVLVDFGLAFDPANDSDDPNIIVGTPAYLAPELCGSRRAAPSPQSDLYALGATAYDLLTGEPPFDDRDILKCLTAQEKDTPQRPSSRRPELRCVDDLLLRMLAKNPTERPVSGSEVASAFAAAAREVGGLPDTPHASLRVLVVGSHAQQVDMLREATGRAYGAREHELRVCESGAEALAAQRVLRAAVVITESLLPDMHGVEFIARLRAESPKRAVEIVTQPESQEMEWRFRAMGVHHFVETVDASSLATRLASIGREHGWI